MTIALRRKPRYERRPRLKLDRRARAMLSRERRWRRRDGGSGLAGRVAVGLVVIGIGMAVWYIVRPEPAPPAPPLAYPELVARAEAVFPEALQGHTRARGGSLSDGRAVPVGLTLLLPAHALSSASASPDALTRLSAPFVGRERAVSVEEMGTRIATLADIALPTGVTRCYTHATGAPRFVALPDRTIRALQLEIAFNPGC